MDPKSILRNYLRFWFWIDTAVVLPDWTFTILQAAMGTKNEAGDSVKLLRILRIVRCLRLLRLAKMKWIMDTIKDLIESESVDILLNIVKMILALIAVNHYIACAWYATSLLDVGPSWVGEHGFDSAHWNYKYITAFHWAITQFTPSSMHVQPQNIFERLFTISVVVLGLVGFSYLVGSITGSLTELRKMKEEASKQFWNLRRFLKKSNISTPLRMRIEKYVEHAWMVQKSSINSVNLPILKLLTEQLRDELNCAMYMPHLEVHPLFGYLSSQAEAARQRIATKALSRKLLARSECIFHAGEIAQTMSFVTVGRLQYFRTFADGSQNNEFVDTDEDWITEPAMWTPEWSTLGELVAVTVSEVLEVSAQGFADAIRRTPHVYHRVCIYAMNFMCWINQKDDREQSDICQGDQIGCEIEQMLLDQSDAEDEMPFSTRTYSNGPKAARMSQATKGESTFGIAKSLRSQISRFR